MNALPKNKIICGLDEVGRGALAGPLVAAAVILTNQNINYLTQQGFILRDSKLLTARNRKSIVDCINKIGVRYKIEIVSVRVINNHGIGKANREIFRKLIKQIPADSHIIDGNLWIGRFHKNNVHVVSIPHADASNPPVILAGIVAKVFRDNLMSHLHNKYPHYNWDQNAGYGTEKHIQSLQVHGMCQYHRRVFVTTALKHV